MACSLSFWANQISSGRKISWSRRPDSCVVKIICPLAFSMADIFRMILFIIMGWTLRSISSKIYTASPCVMAAKNGIYSIKRRVFCHHLGLKGARKHTNATNLNYEGHIHSLHNSFKCHYTSLVYQHIHFVVFTIGIFCRQQPFLFCHS